VHVFGVFDGVEQIDVVQVGNLLTHDGVVADDLEVVGLGHDAHLQQNLRLERLVEVKALEVGEGVLQELHHALVDAALRNLVDDVQRLVQRQRVVVDLRDDFQRVGLYS